MKIIDSLIVLTSVIFVTGSMLTVGMDLKATTDNVSTNVVQAKLEYEKQMYSDNTAKSNKKKMSNSELKNIQTDQATTMYKIKLESLNLNNNISKTNKSFSGKKIENRISVD